MEVKIPFMPEFDVAMLYRRKVCTCRSRAMGTTGDTFLAFGHQFKLLSVSKISLGLVAFHLYKEEGCATPDDFVKIWEKIHPTRGYVPEDVVYLHVFRLLEGEDGGGSR